MDCKIIFSDPAISHLGGIVRHIAQDNQPAATRLGEKLIAHVRPLANFPVWVAWFPNQSDQNIRELIFKSYRIFYRVQDEVPVIQIIRFWHAARGAPEFTGDSEC